MAGVRVCAALSKDEDRFTLYSSVTYPLCREEPGVRIPTETIRRNGYSARINNAETVHKRYQLRKDLMRRKIKVADWCLYIASFGLFIAVCNAETLALRNYAYVSWQVINAKIIFFETMVAMSTITLDLLILLYHCTEIRIELIETGSSEWLLGVTRCRIAKVLLELIVCSVCPFPGIGNVKWPLLGANVDLIGEVMIPLSVLLSLPMFLRSYLACRCILLHSTIFQDQTTKVMANLNHLPVNFLYIIKCQLTERPLTIVTITTICFWIVVAWMLTQCERYTHAEVHSVRHIFDFAWFEIVTFFSIGYGDVKVRTYCGRFLAMLTGIVGTLMSSLFIAVVGRQMQLSLTEKRVNHVVAESQLSSTYKHCAAHVLQCTWKAVRRRRKAAEYSGCVIPKLPIEQRNLLMAVSNFRKSRWKLRMRMEEEDSYVSFRRSYADTLERILTVRRKQLELKERLVTLTQHVDTLKQMAKTSQDEVDIEEDNQDEKLNSEDDCQDQKLNSTEN